MLPSIFTRRSCKSCKSVGEVQKRRRGWQLPQPEYGCPQQQWCLGDDARELAVAGTARPWRCQAVPAAVLPYCSLIPSAGLQGLLDSPVFPVPISSVEVWGHGA